MILKYYNHILQFVSLILSSLILYQMKYVPKIMSFLVLTHFFIRNTPDFWTTVVVEEATKQSWLLDANMTTILAFGRGGHQQQQQQHYQQR